MPPKRKRIASDSESEASGSIASGASSGGSSDDDDSSLESSSSDSGDSDASDEKPTRGRGKGKPAAKPAAKAKALAKPKAASKAVKAKATAKAADDTPKRAYTRKPSFGTPFLPSKYARVREKWLAFPCVAMAEQAYAERKAVEEVKLKTYPTTASSVATSVARADWLMQREITEPKPIQLETETVSVSLVSLTATDGIGNTGGPIASIAFAPTTNAVSVHLIVGLFRIGWPSDDHDYEVEQSEPPPGELGPRFHLQTTTNGMGLGSDYVRNIGRRESHDNLLQVWTAGKSLELAYEVELAHRGSVVSMAFLPQAGFLKDMIGLLAVVCGDGSCLLLALPAKGKDVLLEGSVRVAEVRMPTTMVTSVSWACVPPYDLCCGLSDGTVALYSLQPLDAGFSLTLQQHLTDFSSTRTDPSMFAISAAQICPYNPLLVASAGGDGLLRLWHRADNRLLFTHKCFTPLLDLVWDRIGFGLYYTDCDTPTISWERLWASDACYGKTNYLYRHTTDTGLARISHALHDGHSMVYSACSDGTVRGGYVAALMAAKPPTEALMQFCLIETVTPAPEAAEAAEGAEADQGTVGTVKLVLAPLLLPADDLSNCEHLPEGFSRHAHAIHAIDTMDQLQGDGHLLAYGMACGLLRVQKVNPKALLTGKK